MINQSDTEYKQTKKQNYHSHFSIPEEIRHLGKMSLYRAVAWWGYIRKTAFTRDDVSRAFQIDLRRSSGILNYICHRYQHDDISFEMRKIPVQGGCYQLSMRILRVTTNSASVKRLEQNAGGQKYTSKNSQLDQQMARWLLSRPTDNNEKKLEAWKAGCPINDKSVKSHG